MPKSHAPTTRRRFLGSNEIENGYIRPDYGRHGQQAQMNTSAPSPHTVPTVSVVVPNYNHASYLASRIDTILSQTYRDFELILLDDASTDESMSVIERYRDIPGVQIHRNTQNSGSPFPQWNLGASMARGRFLWIAESDDEAHPEFLATLVLLLEQQPNAALTYCQSLRIDTSGIVIGDFSDWTDPLDKKRWLSPFFNDGVDEVCRFLIQRNTIVNASAVLMRRDRFLKAGGAPPNLRLVGDWVAYCRMLKLGSIAYTPDKFNFFRCHEFSVRAKMDHRDNVQSNLDEYLRVLEIIADEFPVSPDILSAVAHARSRWWMDYVQNTPDSPSLRWAIKSSRLLSRFDGGSQWKMLYRYLTIRALKLPLITKLVKPTKN